MKEIVEMKIYFLIFLSSLAIIAESQLVIPFFNWRLPLPFFGGGQQNQQNQPQQPQPQNQDIVVSFNNPLEPIFERLTLMNFTNLGERRSFLSNAQERFANTVQAGLKALLNSQGADFESFWISNKITIQNASPNLIRLIKAFPGVSSVEEQPEIEIDMEFAGEPEERDNSSRVKRDLDDEVIWSIKKIRADQVWPHGIDGRRIVVAIIDSGVRYTHETLKGRWRSSHGWYDPFDKTPTPNDQSGHGTHVMSTIAGTHGVGVAPRATWIACKACNSKGRCTMNAMFKCGQWIQCPTDTRGNNKDCSKAPDVVANSWGGKGANGFFDSVIQSWRNAGIIPVASIGNSGPNCNSQGSPGERANIIGVGSTDQDDKISSFSSLGPSGDRQRIKPDIVAPGRSIKGAWHTSDTAYNTVSGTSMSCPHVAGVVALMLDTNRNIPFSTVYEAITSTAVRTDLDRNVRTCSGKRGDQFPNNVFGYGRIDAFNAVSAVY